MAMYMEDFGYTTNTTDVDKPDDTKEILEKCLPIDTVLHCVIMISNPCLYKKRYKLAREFMSRKYPNTILYTVEVIYKGQVPAITSKNNKRHLQLYTDTCPIWHKETALNVGIRTLLPKDWRAVAWLDADIEFENLNWASDTLKLLNSRSGGPVVCQLFSHALDLNEIGDPMTIFQGFGYQHRLGKKHGGTGLLFWHSGYSWSMSRSAWDQLEGLYEHSILGSGDANMALALVGKWQASINQNASASYKNHVKEYQDRCIGIELRYCPGVIRHSWHGSKKARKYQERWAILVKHVYNPLIHVTHDINGLLVASDKCPKELLDDILKYFQERQEDE